MAGISVCMIVKNEEEVLARCLACVTSFADELIVVDTGSTDQTKKIAKSFTKKVYDFVWCDDFSKARNFSFSKATQDFIMWLDADDVILKEDQNKLVQLKQQLSSSTSIVMMKYHTTFDEWGNPTFSYYRERLVNRRMQHHWVGVVHEVIPLIGTLQYEDIAITHQKLHAADPNRNLRIYERMVKEGNVLDAREQFYYGRELYGHERYEEAITVLERFLTQRQGWLENNIDACELIGYCQEQLGKKEEALQAYVRSFQYDTPRAELCCDIGQYFFDEQRWREAAFWYETALHQRINDKSGAFVRVDCYGYLPAIQLCVCYWKLQDTTTAMHYNEIAAGYKPDSATVKQNRKFFGNASKEV